MSNDSDLFHTLEQLMEEGWELRGNVFVRGEERQLPLVRSQNCSTSTTTVLPLSMESRLMMLGTEMPGP